MKRSELKDLIQPIVKECVQDSVKEILIGSGLLSAVITEVMKGIQKPLISEQSRTKFKQANAHPQAFEQAEIETGDEANEREMMLMRRKALLTQQEKQKILATKKQLLENVAKDAYSGVNVFAGVKDTIPDEIEAKPGNPLGGIAPNDPGVDISSFIDPNRMKAILGGNKKEK